MSLEKPNTDQSTDGSLAGKMKDAMRKWLRGEVDDMLPARVISYDEETNRAVIKPIVMLGTTSGQKISRANIANIPVFRFGGGGFFMRFPIKPGDLGWLKANDRDISLIMQAQGGEDWPNTLRLHSFSDAMFFPDTFRDWVIDGANVDAAVWQSMDGSVCIALHDGEIKVKAPAIIWDISGAAEMNVDSLVINSAGAVSINSASLDHNGTNIGDDHVHGGSPTAPTGPVSNTQAPI